MPLFPMMPLRSVTLMYLVSTAGEIVNVSTAASQFDTGVNVPLASSTKSSLSAEAWMDTSLVALQNEILNSGLFFRTSRKTVCGLMSSEFQDRESYFNA